jgi:hypothetical protein
MLRGFLNRRATAVPRGVHVHVAADRVIVAATHQNLAGIYYEQPAARVIEGEPRAQILGTAVRQAFDAFSVKDADLSQARKSDWPAFQASGLKSVQEFERQYRTVHCYGLDPSNATVRASIAHPTRAGIELSTSFNPLQAPEEIGVQLLQLVAAASGG